LIFRHLPAEERDLRESLSLDLLQRGELQPEGLFVLPGPDGPCGALLCLPIPGAAGLLWLPGTRPQIGGRSGEPSRTDVDAAPPQDVQSGAARQAAPTSEEQAADALVRHAIGWLHSRGVKLVQCLLIAEEEPLAEPLLRCGFQRITDLWYLRHEDATPVACLDTPARLNFVSFADAPRSLFAQTLERTYEGTLDCPEINGVRTIEEVLAGHQAQGRFDPGRWWLACDGEVPVGVLLMTEQPDSGDWEISYMGVVAEARGRGCGREVLLKALTEAWAAGVRRVVLCVDSRNRPASELYRRMGFEPYDRRAVYLAIAAVGASAGPRPLS
jgi:ribosomal protein S18 acetylase RimI-like enzyme